MPAGPLVAAFVSFGGFELADGVVGVINVILLGEVSCEADASVTGVRGALVAYVVLVGVAIEQVVLAGVEEDGVGKPGRGIVVVLNVSAVGQSEILRERGARGIVGVSECASGGYN